jgi:cobalt-zinc-cadmium resistance protein CzcA
VPKYKTIGNSCNGGLLLIATFLTLFVLPILYIMFEKGTKIIKTKSNYNLNYHPLFVFFFSKGSNAQERISVDTSVELALQNNFKIKMKTTFRYLQQMTRTAYDISIQG